MFKLFNEKICEKMSFQSISLTSVLKKSGKNSRERENLRSYNHF